MIRQVSDVLPQVPDHVIQDDLSNHKGQILLVTDYFSEFTKFLISMH